jgi:uncharacterized protein YegL
MANENMRYEVAPLEAPNEPHLPCVLLLDTSGSMEPHIAALARAINNFKEKTSLDATARKRVDVAIVEFNSTATLVQDFTPIMHMRPVELQSTGSTAMSQGIHLALNMIEKRQEMYQSIGVQVFRPWVFMLTDGSPDSKDPIQIAIDRINERESKGEYGKLKFHVLTVEGANMDFVRRNFKRIINLQDFDFENIFDWLSKSMVTISTSQIGDEPKPIVLPKNAEVIDPIDPKRIINQDKWK